MMDDKSWLFFSENISLKVKNEKELLDYKKNEKYKKYIDKKQMQFDSIMGGWDDYVGIKKKSHDILTDFIKKSYGYSILQSLEVKNDFDFKPADMETGKYYFWIYPTDGYLEIFFRLNYSPNKDAKNLLVNQKVPLFFDDPLFLDTLFNDLDREKMDSIKNGFIFDYVTALKNFNLHSFSPNGISFVFDDFNSLEQIKKIISVVSFSKMRDINIGYKILHPNYDEKTISLYNANDFSFVYKYLINENYEDYMEYIMPKKYVKYNESVLPPYSFEFLKLGIGYLAKNIFSFG